jgi:pimeloyl-ACP methyl ester carboxylesterase
VPFPAPLPARLLASAAARLTLMSGVGYLAAAYASSRVLTRARHKPVRRTPADVGIPFEALEIRTSDGVRLAGWITETAKPRGTVALFHGMRHNREQMLSRVQFLAEAGYRCVTVDHRAHGESSGKRISFGWYEAEDVRAVERWIAASYPGERRFALGVSMGAAALCFAGSSCRWEGVVLEGVYADVCAAFRRRIGLMYPAWFRQLTPAILWITQRRLKVRSHQMRPVDAVRAWSGARVLGITGELDRLAPVGDGRRVIESLPGGANFLVVPVAGHNDVCEAGASHYRDAVCGFFSRS